MTHGLVLQVTGWAYRRVSFPYSVEEGLEGDVSCAEWIRMPEMRRGRCIVSYTNVTEGSEASILLVLANLGEACQRVR